MYHGCEQIPMAKASFTKREYNNLFDSRGVIKNYKKAFPVLVFAAKLGDPHAQNLLGYCYDRGLVTRRNEKAAAHWYKYAAQKNHVEAIYNLGLCYDHGSGVATSAKRAFSLYHKMGGKMLQRFRSLAESHHQRPGWVQ